METEEQRPSYTHGDRIVYGELLISLADVSLGRVRKLLKPQPVTEQTLIDEAGNPYQTLLFVEDGALAFTGDRGSVTLRCISHEIWTDLPDGIAPGMVKQIWLSSAHFAGNPIPGIHHCVEHSCMASLADVMIWNESEARFCHIDGEWRLFNDSGSISDLLNFYWEIDGGRLPEVSESESHQRGTLLVSGVNGNTRRTYQPATP